MSIKFCGLTRERDVVEAVRLGVDALGFNFWAPGPRAVTPEAARELVRGVAPWTARVGVFVDTPPERIREIVARVGLTAVQLHGDETPDAVAALEPLPVIKAVRLGPGFDPGRLAAFPCATFLIDAPGDTPGGTGRSFAWAAARPLARFGRIVVAGGLHDGNVGDAIARARPWGVDVASGIETSPGVKDAGRMAAFVRAVRRAEAGGAGEDGDGE